MSCLILGTFDQCCSRQRASYQYSIALNPCLCVVSWLLTVSLRGRETRRATIPGTDFPQKTGRCPESQTPLPNMLEFVAMGRKTKNQQVVIALQDALEAFLDDQRKFAESDPEWLEEWKSMSDEERKEMPGCGCRDCQRAGELLGSIY
jgi:hypothetical protein